MNNYIHIVTWEIKRNGKVKELSTLDRIEYECFVEYLKEHNYLYEILENYVLEVK